VAGRSIVGDVLPLMALASFLLIDALELSRGNPLRDLRLYLLAGERFLDGVAVYRTAPLTALLDDPSLYPFLYPPPVIPIVALLAALPYPLVAGAWVLMSLAALVAGLRALGVRWQWIPLLLAWPGVFVGLWVGNVAIPAFLFLALALRLPALLALGPLFKVQLAIPALWLVRERRWAALAGGVGAVLIGVLVTLPIVGVGAWFDWWAGLRAFQASQAAFQGLYALALPRLLPYAAFLVVAAAVVGWALVGRGRDGLARLGLASVVASPSLYRHGFLSALPQVLRLDASLVWLVLGAGVTLNGLWLGVALAAAASVLDLIRRRGSDPLHPLGEDGLWPTPRHQSTDPGVEGP
ncbi:MAG TPA: glycosyltransferase 87 family protein, partial [Candidatus Limnocylindrales bacterium]|nr:glycosyltransferase 87 family protein [Candidatus Limnocylindrales bacterium]